MATSNHTQGFLPTVNDTVAILAIMGVYLTRFGVVAEGQSANFLLQLTTDFLLPLFGAMWLLAVPTYQVYRKVC